MIDEVEISSTKSPKPTREKSFLLYLNIFLLCLLFIIPIYSVRKYAQILAKTPPTPSRSIHAQCGVVLTGAAGRIREGITLLSHGWVEKLIISGVHQRSTLADMFPEILFYPEIDLEKVILERRSSSTAGNAQQSLPIVEALHCQSVLLVTSDYHMFRAMKMFKQVFPPTVSLVAYPVASDRMHKRSTLFFDARFWGTVFEEWYKYLFYSVFVF